MSVGGGGVYDAPVSVYCGQSWRVFCRCVCMCAGAPVSSAHCSTSVSCLPQ